MAAASPPGNAQILRRVGLGAASSNRVAEYPADALARAVRRLVYAARLELAEHFEDRRGRQRLDGRAADVGVDETVEGPACFRERRGLEALLAEPLERNRL